MCFIWKDIERIFSMNIERNFSILSKSFLVQNIYNRSRKKKNTPFKSFKKKMVGSQNIYLIIYFVHKNLCIQSKIGG